MAKVKLLIYPMLVLLALAASVAGLLGWMWRTGMLEGGRLSGLGQVLMLIVGMLTMAAMEVLYGLITFRWPSANIPSASIERLAASREIDTLQAVGVDNSLALAMLRVKIEQELQHFGLIFLKQSRRGLSRKTADMSIGFKPRLDIQSVYGMIEEVYGMSEVGYGISEAVNRQTKNSNRRDIDPMWVKEIKEIIAICDQAIHGNAIDTDQALRTVRKGEELLHKLRLSFPFSLAA